MNQSSRHLIVVGQGAAGLAAALAAAEMVRVRNWPIEVTLADKAAESEAGGNTRWSPSYMPSSAPSDAILVANDIVVQFDTPEGPITAVDNVSLKVRPGEFLSIIGPSGCGKSTLFNVIGGLLGNYQGAVNVAGETISGPHKSIGMVFQEESTFPWRTVTDNVAFPLELVGMPKRERIERARHFIKLVGLDGFENRYPGELSGGMRQRVSLARTLASEPKILLMDEPFAALDEQTRLLLGDKVLQIQQQLKQTTLLITHNITEAVQMSDRILVMTYRPGKLKRIVDIDLPRPRTSEIVGSEAFGRYVAQIWNDLREEANRGMRARASIKRSSTNGSVTFVAEVSFNCSSEIFFACSNALNTAPGSHGCFSANVRRTPTKCMKQKACGPTVNCVSA